ncbi:hypothetical protein ACNFH5_25540 [Pseudomonas sp. NY15435]|uniref:hypothetical protein n=1 Tax=Pseudomonas sp. NY15435 TaxID=3400358 RepID=UPI003A8AA701
MPPLSTRQYLAPRFLLPLLATSIALGCVVFLFRPTSMDDLPTTAALPQRMDHALDTAPIYSEPGAEAHQHARDFLDAIDKAIGNGVELLRGADGTSIQAQSRYFNALVNAGYAQFGSSYYEPLGSCGAAGSSARNVWHAQIRSANSPADNKTVSEVRKALATLQRDRDNCLDAAHPLPEEGLTWTPEPLIQSSPLPDWEHTVGWSDSAAGWPATNL